MGKLAGFAAVALLGGIVPAFAAIEIDAENFIMRQQWPWSRKIVAEFQANGTVETAGAGIKVKAYRGEELLGEVPVSAITGDTVITGPGRKRIEFDPADVPGLGGKGMIRNFRLGVEYVDGDFDRSDKNILYLIIDLAKQQGEAGQIQIVTEGALTGGSTAAEGTGPFGAWKRKIWADGVDTVAWTGVTENDEYKTTKLVLRHIPAQKFMMGARPGEPGSADELLKLDPSTGVELKHVSGEGVNEGYGIEYWREVELTKSYYIGVFELTQKQWETAWPERSVNWNQGKGPMYPANMVSYTTMRGEIIKVDGKDVLKGDAYNPAAEDHGVEANSFMGALAARLGVARGSFDLPSEAQWECACRAGTQGGLYSGKELPAEYNYYLNERDANSKPIPVHANVDELAIYWNTSEGGASCEVGLKAANNYGLYDMLGNVGEMCLDKIATRKNFNENTPGFGNMPTVDPVLAPGSSGNYRVMKGGTSDSFATYSLGLMAFRSGARRMIGNTAGVRHIGFRVCFNPSFAGAAQ